MSKQIEYELRVSIPVEDFDKAHKLFDETYRLDSHTVRVSFMSFFKLGDNQYDLRIRKTNDKSEIVLKIGGLHASDRTEISQPIDNVELNGLIKMFSHLSNDSYIALRETYNFTDGKVMVSLVKSDSVAYIEYELISEDDGHDDGGKYLYDLVNSHGYTPLDEEGFKYLNQALDKDDWQYTDDETCSKRLNDTIKKIQL